MIRHLTATVAYRFAKQVKAAPTHFATFDAGNDVVSPVKIVNHITVVIRFAQQLIDKTIKPTAPKTKNISEAAEIFHNALQLLDEMLLERDIEEKVLCQIIQGPLADALTHIGQLSTLRRLSGAPVYSENYMLADIQSGRVGATQTISEHQF